MKRKSKKSGQKITKAFTKFSKQASQTGVEHIKENVVGRISHVKDVRLLILEWGLLILTLTILAVVQAFWHNESYAVNTYGEGGTYIEATVGKVNSLNPLFASTDSEKTLSKLLFASLAASDYSGHIGLDLASSIAVNEDGNIWTVKLRDGLKWSDGQPITREDVLFTIGLIQNPRVNTIYSSNFNGVKIEDKDESVIFTLPVAYANFSSALDIPILPKHILKDVDPAKLVESNFSTTPVTSGAFSYNAMQSVGSEGEKIVYLVANKNYYKGRPMLDAFTVHAYTKEDDILSAMNSGSISGTSEISVENLEKVNSAIYTEKQTAINDGIFAFFNTESDIFKDKNLRKAVQQAVDMRSLRAPLSGELSLDYPILSSQIKLNNYPKLPDYDPDGAKEIIKKAELPEGTTVNITTIDTGVFPRLAENLKYQLDNLGLKSEINIYAPDQDFLISVIKPRTYDILIYEVEMGADPDLFAFYHSSQATESGLNLSNYKNALANDSILAARSAMDTAKRISKYETFLKSWVEDAPAIGICQSNIHYFVNKGARSFSTDNRLVQETDRFADIVRWATEETKKNRTP